MEDFTRRNLRCRSGTLFHPYTTGNTRSLTVRSHLYMGHTVAIGLCVSGTLRAVMCGWLQTRTSLKARWSLKLVGVVGADPYILNTRTDNLKSMHWRALSNVVDEALVTCSYSTTSGLSSAERQHSGSPVWLQSLQQVG